jgi:methylated-DNA-[protein]-cysteine S-methyltransferase
MIYFTSIDSPIGPLLLTSDGAALTGLHMSDSSHPPRRDADWIESPRHAPFGEARRQLGEYFAGARREFDLPLAAQGTPFQRKVWQALRQIRYGETQSYGEVAARIRNPAASRAVGLANGRNPIAVVVPCHRVIGANGSLTGFGGGLARKRWLLEHEGSWPR